MSFCVKCGMHYYKSHEHSFCAQCGNDLRKPTLAEQVTVGPTQFQQPSPKNQTGNQKPVAGIVVALVLGVVGLIWNCAVLFHYEYGNPNNVQVLIYQAFPALQIKNLIGYSVALLGNTSLVIGALMAHLNHPNGVRVVRITIYSMIATTVLSVIMACFAVFGADSWTTLDAPTKGAMIGGLVGGIIGAIIDLGLLLFLFRKGKSEEYFHNADGNPKPDSDDFFDRFAKATYKRHQKKPHDNPNKKTESVGLGLPEKIRYECPQCKLIMTGTTSEIGKIQICPGCKGPFFPVPH